MTATIALPIFLALMARVDYLRRSNPAIERPAQIVGVLTILGAALSLAMIAAQ